MKRLLRSVCTLLALIAAQPAGAADWPTKPIHIVVTFAPGGAADIWARIIAEHLSTALKQSVVIENRGGGGGIVASAQVARAEPDGHTILMGGLAPQILAPAVAGNAGFDALRDFTHIAYIGGPPIVLVVPPSSELRSVDDVIRAQGARPTSSPATPSSGVGTLPAISWSSSWPSGTGPSSSRHIPHNTAALPTSSPAARRWARSPGARRWGRCEGGTPAGARR
jgi:tripartite-type tricarboxylate transporter receptor subunit TctC